MWSCRCECAECGHADVSTLNGKGMGNCECKHLHSYFCVEMFHSCKPGPLTLVHSLFPRGFCTLVGAHLTDHTGGVWPKLTLLPPPLPAACCPAGLRRHTWSSSCCSWVGNAARGVGRWGTVPSTVFDEAGAVQGQGGSLRQGRAFLTSH